MTKNFTDAEFYCPCGCEQKAMAQDFMDRLQTARDIYGRAMRVTSGYRCPEYNKKIGGVPDSAHTHGKAADIFCDTSHKRYAMINSFLGAGFTRIGIGKMFIHIDTDSTKPEYVIFHYYIAEHQA